LKLFRVLYVAVVFAGPYLTVSVVWGIADVFNGLMAFPNLVALLVLTPEVARTTRAYFARLKTRPTECR
jgi:AGCS family alanine or glycine:cation symporter